METFTGKLEPMGFSVFMQGSHKLVDDKGDMIVILQAIEDGAPDLNSFVNKKVKVSGPTEDTVEAGQKILEVKNIEAL